MRKKLRTFVTKIKSNGAATAQDQAFHSSAQEVAQYCATSCALLHMIMTSNRYSPDLAERNFLI
jgi:hypothetical protein